MRVNTAAYLTRSHEITKARSHYEGAVIVTSTRAEDEMKNARNDGRKSDRIMLMEAN